MPLRHCKIDVMKGHWMKAVKTVVTYSYHFFSFGSSWGIPACSLLHLKHDVELTGMFSSQHVEVYCHIATKNRHWVFFFWYATEPQVISVSCSPDCETWDSIRAQLEKSLQYSTIMYSYCLVMLWLLNSSTVAWIKNDIALLWHVLLIKDLFALLCFTLFTTYPVWINSSKSCGRWTLETQRGLALCRTTREKCRRKLKHSSASARKPSSWIKCFWFVKGIAHTVHQLRIRRTSPFGLWRMLFVAVTEGMQATAITS